MHVATSGAWESNELRMQEDLRGQERTGEDERGCKRTIEDARGGTSTQEEYNRMQLDTIRYN